MNHKKIDQVCFTAALLLWQVSCSTAPQTTPTQTAVPDTSTPQASSTPAGTSTPEATSTETATVTPDVTATLLPEITPPAEGMGNVVGLLIWDSKPVAKAAIWLCKEFTGYDCASYKTNSDKNGYYVFKNVAPGSYIVAINSFSSSWFIFYFDVKGNKELTISAGQTLVLDPWSIYKFDLHATAPKGVTSNAAPTFKWEPYPDAAYYQISIFYDTSQDMYNPDMHALETDTRVDGTEFTLKDPLVTCKYNWELDAFNDQGAKIATSTSIDFNNIDLPTSC